MMVTKIADFEINDVAVTVVFPPHDPVSPGEDPQHAYARFDQAPFRNCDSSELVVVWRDATGTVRFIAPPQLHLFFERVSFEQLAAQVSREIPGDRLY